MGMVGANLSEAVGRKKHFNPRWETSEKPPGPGGDGNGGGPSVASHIRKKHEQREHGSVDWASRFAADERFGGAKQQWQAEHATNPGGGTMGSGADAHGAAGVEVPDFAALVEQARKIAETAKAAIPAVDPAEARARLLEADARWGAGLALDGQTYFFNREDGSTRWDPPKELRSLGPVHLVLGEPLVHPTLPAPWRELRDPMGRPYYWDVSAGVTRWERPLPEDMLVGRILPAKRKAPEQAEEQEKEEEAGVGLARGAGVAEGKKAEEAEEETDVIG